jgi:MerR family copper efflux transcriptional regulator
VDDDGCDDLDATLRVHLEYLQAKAALWDARDRADASDEAAAQSRVHGILPELEASICK